MSRKYLLTVSLLLPFMAVSSLAHAGPTITDKRWYWPNETRSYAPSGPYAMEQRAPWAQVVPLVNNEPYGSRSCTWLGGPKSSFATCAR
jgi:hypothetical protein